MTGPAPLQPDMVSLTFPGTALAVRRGLEVVLESLAALELLPEEYGTVELVLAEALNNIVEHAYAGTDDGWIKLSCNAHPEGLCFAIRDEGQPMPDGEAPIGRRTPLPEELDALPEGGFGWFLIRDLSHDVHYGREGNANLLTFRIKVGLGTTVRN